MDKFVFFLKKLIKNLRTRYPYIDIGVSYNSEIQDVELIFYKNQNLNYSDKYDFVILINEKEIKYFKVVSFENRVFSLIYKNFFELKFYVLNLFYSYLQYRSKKDLDYFSFLTFIFNVKISSYLDILTYLLDVNEVPYENLLDNKIYIYKYGNVYLLNNSTFRVVNLNSISYRYYNVNDISCVVFFSSLFSLVKDDENLEEVYIFNSEENSSDEDLSSSPFIPEVKGDSDGFSDFSSGGSSVDMGGGSALDTTFDEGSVASDTGETVSTGEEGF